MVTRFLTLVALLATSLCTFLCAQKSDEIEDSFQAGRKLDSSLAKALEQRLAERPKDQLARIKLIAFYTFSGKVEPSQAVLERRKHLLWMAQNSPKSPLWGQRSYGTAVYVKGGPFPDPEGFEQIRKVWLTHLGAKPDSETSENAASFLELGDRATALQLVRQKQNPRYLGTFIALTLLGVTARDFDTGEPLDVDPSVRTSDFGKMLLEELERATDPQVLGGAGFWLSRDGATLWSKGFRDWDYSTLAKSLLARARTMEPSRLDWAVSNPELPQPGEVRGVGIIRVGGNVMEQRVANLVEPVRPRNLSGATGTVRLNIAVGADGRVIKAVPVAGPKELYDITVRAVEQWAYRPTTVAGKPVIVLSVVEVAFR